MGEASALAAVGAALTTGLLDEAVLAAGGVVAGVMGAVALVWACAEVMTPKISANASVNANANDHSAAGGEFECLKADEIISTNRQRLLLRVPLGFEELHKAGVGVCGRWQIIDQQGRIDFGKFVRTPIILDHVDADQADQQGNQWQGRGDATPQAGFILTVAEYCAGTIGVYH